LYPAHRSGAGARSWPRHDACERKGQPEPVTGELRDFVPGEKTIGLVAAAEWFDRKWRAHHEMADIDEEWLDRVKGTMAIDMVRLSRNQMTGHEVVERLLQISELSRVPRMCADGHNCPQPRSSPSPLTTSTTPFAKGSSTNCARSPPASAHSPTKAPAIRSRLPGQRTTVKCD
jgi:hypothetical protein